MDEEFAHKKREMEISLAMFFTVHDDPEDTENFEPPLAGGDRQLQHLASWLIGEGWKKEV